MATKAEKYAEAAAAVVRAQKRALAERPKIILGIVNMVLSDEGDIDIVRQGDMGDRPRYLTIEAKHVDAFVSWVLDTFVVDNEAAKHP